MNRRNAALTLLALGAAPRALAQARPTVQRIGYLTPRSRPSPPERDEFSDAFALGMRELGYGEGKSLEIERRYGDGDYRRLPGTAAVQAAQQATKTIPIVIAAAVDPVGSGLVASLSRPGGNTTGLSAIAVDLSPKHLELHNIVMPKLTRVAACKSRQRVSCGCAEERGRRRQRARHRGNCGICTLSERDRRRRCVRDKAGGRRTYRGGGSFFSGQGTALARASIKNRIPTISIYQDHVIAGGLMSYGQNIADYHRQSATFVDKILKGARPEDLPVEQPTRIEFDINAKTAKVLGITIPQSLLGRADEVIHSVTLAAHRICRRHNRFATVRSDSPGTQPFRPLITTA